MSKVENQRDNHRGTDDQNESGVSESLSTSEGKLFPPSSEVEVPRMPAKVNANQDTDAVTPDDAAPDAAAANTPPPAAPGDTSRPAKIDTTESNWADSTQPAPDKRTARSSIL